MRRRSTDRLPKLTGQVQIARCGDGLILLDVAGDAYRGLYAPVGQPFVVPAQLPGAWRDAIDTLRTRGGNRRRLSWTDDEAAEKKAPLTIAFVGCFLFALILAGIRFHRKDLEGLIASAMELPATGQVATTDASVLAACFDRCAAWLPFRMPCLLRTYVLLHLLHAAGHSAQWIFGAALFPFRAHCWLAQGRRLLDERAERLLDYEIMLSVPVAGA